MTKTKIKKGTFRSKQESQYRNFWQNNIKGFACEDQWGTLSDFREIVGPRKSGKHNLRRVNPNLPATPDNVQWTTSKSRNILNCKYMLGDKPLISSCKNKNQYQLALIYIRGYNLDPKTALAYASKPRTEKTKIRRAALTNYLQGGAQ